MGALARTDLSSRAGRGETVSQPREQARAALDDYWGTRSGTTGAVVDYLLYSREQMMVRGVRAAVPSAPWKTILSCRGSAASKVKTLHRFQARASASMRCSPGKAPPLTSQAVGNAERCRDASCRAMLACEGRTPKHPRPAILSMMGALRGQRGLTFHESSSDMAVLMVWKRSLSSSTSFKLFCLRNPRAAILATTVI